ncbi:hypothetical protein [Petrachloros mirabilis]
MTRITQLSIGAVLMGFLGAQTADASEFRFVASNIALDRVIWQPSLTLIDNKMDLEGGVVFVIENPTSTPHVFDVPGLLHITGVQPSGEEKTEPLSITVEPKETQRIRISTKPLEGTSAQGRQFRVRCLIHQQEHLSGSIFVVTDSFRNSP